MKQENWGHHHSLGTRNVERLTIGDGAGLSASILTFGAALQDLRLLKSSGQELALVLGLKDLKSYVEHSPYMGSWVGRLANRTAFARVKGLDCQLDANEKPHHLHGGSAGTAQRIWTLADHQAHSLDLSLSIAAFDDGYPGDLTLRCRYAFVKAGQLQVSLWATVSAPCPLNFAHHPYWNLSGEASGCVHQDHDLKVQAEALTLNDASGIPLLDLSLDQPTAQAWDFREARCLCWAGRPLAIDNSYVLSRVQKSEPALQPVASLRSRKSGLAMHLSCDQPHMQVYTGHGLNVPVAGIGGRLYGAFDGLCLEPQRRPDCANQDLLSCLHGPDRPYEQKILYTFEELA